MEPDANELKFGVSAKALAGWEIASVVVSCLLAQWLALSVAVTVRWVVLIPVFLALGLIFFSHRAYQENAKQLGFRFDNFFVAGRALILPTLVGLIAIIVLAWFTSSAFSLGRLKRTFIPLVMWALFQQYVLQGYINRRAQTILGKGIPSVLLVGMIFGALHLPNLVLAGLTTVGGWVWAFIYQRHPNLYALAISHAVTSIFIASSLPPKIINSLRVGFKFFG
jgi:membrane protease YdiL (CAAX protease family)